MIEVEEISFLGIAKARAKAKRYATAIWKAQSNEAVYRVANIQIEKWKLGDEKGASLLGRPLVIDMNLPCELALFDAE